MRPSRGVRLERFKLVRRNLSYNILTVIHAEDRHRFASERPLPLLPLLSENATLTRPIQCKNGGSIREIIKLDAWNFNDIPDLYDSKALLDALKGLDQCRNSISIKPYDKTVLCPTLFAHFKV